MHRIQRLLEPAPPLRSPARLAGVTAEAGSLALPAALACTTIAVLAAAAVSLITG